MNIGIDGTTLALNIPCGSKSYSLNLINNIALLDNKNKYFIFSPIKIPIPKNSNFRLILTPSPLPMIKRQFLLNRYVIKYNLDVFHFLHPYGDPFLKHPKTITTIHDMDLGKTLPFFSKYFLTRLIYEFSRRMVIAKTRIFLVPTKFTESELFSYLGDQRKQNISVIPYGVSTRFQIKPDSSSKKNYFICMGDFSNRKNILNIFNAYSQLPVSTKLKYSLRVISPDKKSASRFVGLSKRLNLESNIEILIDVSDKKLVDLYNYASCLIFPSLYEGFGFPIIEAMACGCPVITSNIGAMKEVASDAAILVNPNSTISIKRAMLRIVEDPNLRNKLIRRGTQRVNSFNWPLVAKKTIEVYKQLGH